jgi:hypothetical protein
MLRRPSPDESSTIRRAKALDGGVVGGWERLAEDTETI